MTFLKFGPLSQSVVTPQYVALAVSLVSFGVKKSVSGVFEADEGTKSLPLHSDG